MKRPFQVGDRVVVYWYPVRYTGKVIEITNKGRALSVLKDSDGVEILALPQQCRRLIPKKRRSVWLNLDMITSYVQGERVNHYVVRMREEPADGYIEFVERKPK